MVGVGTPAAAATRKLFCFASRTVENIVRGVAARRWAVATVSDPAMRSRLTKARRYLEPGDCGLLYCNPTHAFTVPFIVESKADPSAVILDIWPEPWVLPFHIRPLGNANRQLPQTLAQTRWSVLQRRMNPGDSVSGKMNITGTTVFVPVMISEAEWQEILRDLAVP